MATGEEEPAAGKLPVWRMAADVMRVYGHHWKLLVPMAVVVLLPQALADAASGGLEVEGVHSWRDAAELGAIPLTALASLVGEAFYAGLVAAVVLEWRGGRAVRIRQLARVLPYRRLVGSDLLLTVGFALGLILLVVPGIVFMTLFFLSPVLIKIEGIGVRESFRRSAILVRGSFWRVLGVAIIVLLGTEIAVQVAQIPLHHFIGDLEADLAVDAALEPFQGLVTVLVALALLELRGELPASAVTLAPSSPA
jgi:hypothetical protein